jgi:hypothetical protein
MEAVIQLKEQGNAAFRAGSLQEAAQLYTLALAACDGIEMVDAGMLHDLHNNR